MRGGAIPVLAWGTLLLVLAIGNWIWDAKTVNGATATLATLIIYAVGVALWLARRESIRRGPPEPRTQTEALPQDSLAAVLIGLSIGCIGFGLTWAKFLVYFGAAMLALSVARLVLELRAQRASRRQWQSDRQEGGR